MRRRWFPPPVEEVSRPNVRSGSLADIGTRFRDVRLLLKSGHGHHPYECSLSPIGGRGHVAVFT
jgi:hypothetical protein